MAISPMPSICIFCGGLPLTREHIWADWFRAHLPRTLPFYHSGRIVLNEDNTRTRNSKKMSGDPRSKKLRIVCNKCNNGWMSDLQNATKPILTPLLHHQQITLSEQQRADEARDRIFVGEDADDIGAPLDLSVEPFERIDNRYEMRGADSAAMFKVVAYGVTIGTEAPGARRCGQADPLHEPRARVVSWPPLRLARLRRERESVVVCRPRLP
jgi:hypothetical protein